MSSRNPSSTAEESSSSRSRPIHRVIALAFLLSVTMNRAAGAHDPPSTTGAPRGVQGDEQPLPEHPRPDFERPHWLNLNGFWSFRFDADDAGVDGQWFSGDIPFDRTIIVPFPWGSPLSGVEDEAYIGWYAREVEIPKDWRGRRVFLTIGAADWHTTAWLDGVQLGTHQGGYTPFSFELTHHVRPGEAQHLVVRVDDADRDFKLEGKQGYGNARGIWQTPYLEVRGDAALEYVHFLPDIRAEKVGVRARLAEPALHDLALRLDFLTGDVARAEHFVLQGAQEVTFDLDIPTPRLWTLDRPFLYEVEATLGVAGADDGEGSESAPPGPSDRVRTYFGMREISVVDLPGTDYPYVALNGEPIYLQLALDQAYHPKGYYTFPSDDFIRDEILRAQSIGLNGVRIHVKIGIPRKLYWADRAGMLVMADVPNSWGEPTAAMRQEVEYALRRMIERDFNHPSIFSWVPFNETWGLYTRFEADGEDVWRYLPETKDWVVDVVRQAKALDPTRLVEDNSVCCGVGHTETDLNSWHAYLPGWAWMDHLRAISDSTYEGSTWNFEDGWRQARQPNVNSEFGNVWGYEGSTGDVDWSWDYHRALNAFRRHPKIAGWLYTEHHDVINEWNGYWRYDRSEKETGLDELVEGMSLRDLHAPFYLAPGVDVSVSAAPGEVVTVPLFASFMTPSTAFGDTLILHTELYGWNRLGERQIYDRAERLVPSRPWMQEALEPLEVEMPAEPAVAVLVLRLEDDSGYVLHRNFTAFVVEGGDDRSAPATWGGGATTDPRERIIHLDAAAFSGAEWSLKQWDVLDGLKVNGAGHGHFEYRVPWPGDLDPSAVDSAIFVVEVSAKQLFGKDRDPDAEHAGDFMRGGGAHDPSLNPNAYPMTDEVPYPSRVRVRVSGHDAGTFDLPDDPADHRGILSWHNQLRDGRLREAGSYGYLVRADVPRAALEAAAERGELLVRLEVDEALPGGLAIYGRQFGRYPVPPTMILRTAD